MSSHIEREVKLAVWPGFTLPSLDDAAAGIVAVAADDQRLDAVYHDTPDLRLARENITIRFRNDGGWTLKLPDEPFVVGGLTRREVSAKGDAKTVPDALRALVASRVRSAALAPVARLRTVRHRTDLVDREGAVVAEVVDDEVSVLDGRRVALRFREVEVELGDGASEAVLDAVVARLRSAGAGAPDPTPKVVRALGPRAQVPRELARRPVGKQPTAADVLAAGLAASVTRLLESDPIMRTTDEPEGVHQARVATRRLRSDLRTFGDLLEPAWAGPLRDELRWVADVLGEVRDPDVLLIRLRRQLDGLRRSDRVVGTALLDVVAGARADARGQLDAVLGSERYFMLLDRLVAAAGEPLVRPGAAAPASKVLPRLARRPWAALEKAAARIGPNSADEELHAVRVKAKRARYAAEVAARVIGKPAQQYADEVARVQDVLGEHQDACVAREWLRTTAVGVEPAAAFVAGQLAMVQDTEAAARRREWVGAWERASKKKHRAWLTR